MSDQEETIIKCTGCKGRYFLKDYPKNRLNEPLKTCMKCKEKRDKYKCEHGIQKAGCKECNGSSICEHGIRKATCKKCDGSSLCEHNKQKSRCKECSGSSICEHNKRKSQCKECNGSSFCKHNKRKCYCIDCGGSSLCASNRKPHNILCLQWANPKYDKYCMNCYIHYFPDTDKALNARCTSKENKVKVWITNEFKDTFIHNKPLYLGDCSCKVRRRIDLYTPIGNTLLCIEVDENQHKGYKKEDEEARFNDLYMAHGGKFVYIRYNPDQYKDKDGKKKNPTFEKRIVALVKEVRKQIKRIKDEENDDLVEIHKMFYDE